jgi:ATP-dependent Lhr-like helicase
VLEALRARGASFLKDVAGYLRFEGGRVHEAVGTLVASGLVASDGFSGLRALVRAAQGRTGHDRRATFAGRWSARVAPDARDASAAAETQAWAVLRRYGVVFRKLLTRETNALPWRDLTRTYRRLEARGEIRGGRFVSGMAGEQFALPGAVELLREVRRTAPDGAICAVSAADPLNLAGIVTPGDRIRVAGRNRIAYRNGVPIAVREGDFIRELAPLDSGAAAEVRQSLKHRSPALTQR